MQQATFIAARLEAGEGVDEIVANYGVGKSEVIKARALIDLYRMCRLAPLIGRAKELVENPEEFPTSIIFERLIEPKKVGTLLGFEITERGLLAPAGDKTLALLARILDDIASDVIDTRELNSEAEQLKYVSKLGFKPDAAKKVDANQMEAATKPKPSANPSTSPTASTQAASNPPRSKTQNRSATVSGRLFPRSLVCELSNAKLLSLIDEGKDLEVAACPNTCSILLRCVLDIALQLAMDERKVVSSVLAKYRKPNRDKLSTIDLLEEIKPGGLIDIGLDGMEVRTIDPLKAKGPLTYDSLHLVIHNIHWAATADNVSQLRSVVVPLIQKAIRKP